jgi:hypothetical protein
MFSSLAFGSLTLISILELSAVRCHISYQDGVDPTETTLTETWRLMRVVTPHAQKAPTFQEWRCLTHGHTAMQFDGCVSSLKCACATFLRLGSQKNCICHFQEWDPSRGGLERWRVGMSSRCTSGGEGERRDMLSIVDQLLLYFLVLFIPLSLRSSVAGGKGGARKRSYI